MVFAQPVSAETLAEARNKISGLEVEVSGLIGTGLNMMDDEALAFRDEQKNTYEVVFDAGREARKKLSGCKFEILGAGSPCPIKGKAEIELSGSDIRLIIFDVQVTSNP